MKTFISNTSFVITWIIGCIIFDALLKVSGVWMMLCGVLTFHAAAFVKDSVADKYSK